MGLIVRRQFTTTSVDNVTVDVQPRSLAALEIDNFGPNWLYLRNAAQFIQPYQINIMVGYAPAIQSEIITRLSPAGATAVLTGVLDLGVTVTAYETPQAPSEGVSYATPVPSTLVTNGIATLPTLITGSLFGLPPGPILTMSIGIDTTGIINIGTWSTPGIIIRPYWQGYLLAGTSIIVPFPGGFSISPTRSGAFVNVVATHSVVSTATMSYAFLQVQT